MFMHSRIVWLFINCECCSLDWVLPMMLLFLHVTCSCIVIFFFIFVEHRFLLYLLFAFSLSFRLWHLRNPFLRRTWYLVVVLYLLLLFLLEIGSVIRNPKKILRRTFVTKRFFWNSKSFYLIFQTHLFPVHLALWVGNFFARNPLGVLVCLYRSSSPTYTLSILLFLVYYGISRNMYCSYSGAHF